MLFAPVLFVLCAFTVGKAMGQQEAISWVRGGGYGYITNGAGFAFSPVTSIAVTALGFGGVDQYGSGTDLSNYPYRVTLYNSSGTTLATAEITIGSAFHNQTYYQTVSPVELTAGSTYYLGAAEVGGPGGNLWVGTLAGTEGGGFFVDGDIHYLYGEADFAPPGNIPLGQEVNAYPIGANFEFSPVPEPSFLCLSAVGVLVLFLRRRRV